jgi:hypothetical protein
MTKKEKRTPGGVQPQDNGGHVGIKGPPQEHIFYRGTDGAIYHVFWDQSINNFGLGPTYYDQWTQALNPGPNDSPKTQAPPAAGDPATMVYGLQQHIFYRGTDGAIYHVFWDEPSNNFGNGPTYYDQWSGTNVGSGRPTTMAAGDPATMVSE